MWCGFLCESYVLGIVCMISTVGSWMHYLGLRNVGDVAVSRGLGWRMMSNYVGGVC